VLRWVLVMTSVAISCLLLARYGREQDAATDRETSNARH